MSRREQKIPVHIHKNGSSKDGEEFLEISESQETDDVLAEAENLYEQSHEEEISQKELHENVAQGLSDHHEQSPKEPVPIKDRRHIILWLFVSVFVLLIAIVWVFSLRANFMSINKTVSEKEEAQLFESVSDKFTESFEYIRNNMKDFDGLKESIETEETKDKAINDLKTKIKNENTPGELPDTN